VELQLCSDFLFPLSRPDCVQHKIDRFLQAAESVSCPTFTQEKAYYLGTYSTIEEAIEARRKGEELLHTGTAEYYARWKALADADPEWAEENPISIRVERDGYGELKVRFEPAV